ncbi:nonribosomal peptide synthetase protein BlmIV [Lentzea fradiae]|uniref:Nonribosomal peptide synthetase protein BlmIV n=1 Tax=Lentzea fradiae TaxID=200378 RepID=A0A1G8CTU1_9PSEU|nr:non-ribosomal peptide synthetase [Lentzea fradiae]SDH48693.1 nonribosomal peptide synthetase protein BlmIV [Lentzea fradiae]
MTDHRTTTAFTLGARLPAHRTPRAADAPAEVLGRSTFRRPEHLRPTTVAGALARLCARYGGVEQADLERLVDADSVAAPLVVDTGSADGPPLRWTFTPVDDHVELVVSGTPSWWFPGTVQLMADQLARLITEPENSSDDVFSAAELTALAEFARAGEPPWDLDTCLLEFVRDQASLLPDHVAVADASGETTYSELIAEAEGIAGELRQHSGPGDLVALVVDRGAHLIAAMLATWHNRTAFLALEPDADPATARKLVEAAGVVCVVTTHDHLDAVRTLDLPVVTAPSAPPAAPQAADDCCRPADLAYVMFTSGTTGLPKGVGVDHLGMLNHARAKIADLQITEHSVIAQCGPIGFDILVWQCVAGLAVGARVEVFSNDEVQDVARLLARVDERAVTVWQAVPSLIRAALDTAGVLGLRHLRWLVPTGDALPSDLCRDWLDRYPDVPVLNTYGSTECSDDQCHHVITAVTEDDPAIMWIGAPIPGMATYVLDPAGRLLPPGVPGELHIGGVGVGPGYVGRPDLTAAKFPDDPFAGLPGARMYRSGDLVRQRPDGVLEFFNRIDDTVKIRGRRLEVGGTEAALRALPEVKDCAVAVHKPSHDLTDAVLVAHVVPADPAADEEVLRATVLEHARRVLHPDVTPHAVVVLDALPLSANGKVDRRALPAPGLTRSQGQAVAPADEVETRLAELWAKLLGLTEVGRHDNFFTLGGHSLVAARLLSAVRDDFGVAVTLPDLFDEPTVEGLAKAVRRAAPAPGPVAETLAEDLVPGEPFPLSDLQQAYWVGEDDYFTGGGTKAHLHVEFDSAGLDLDRAALAVDRVVARHDALRLVVTPDGRQRVLADVPPFRPEMVDLTGLDPRTAEDRLGEIRADYRDHGGTTSTWPLFDATAVRLPGGRTRVFFRISLLLVDAHSENVLIAEWLAAYRGGGLPVAEPHGAYRRAVTAVQALADPRQRARARAHWSERLADLPPAPALPAARRSGTGRFTRRTTTLSPELWSGFRRHAAAHGLTPSAALFTLYAEVLARWSARSRFTVNTLASNRMRLDPATGQIVGNLSTTLPVVVDHTTPTAFADRAVALQQQIVRDLQHAGISGVALLRDIAAAKGWAPDNVLPVVFASTLDVDGDFQPPPFDLTLLGSGLQTPHVHLDHQVYDYGGEFVAHFDSVDDVFEQDVPNHLHAAYERGLRALATDEAAWRSEHVIPDDDVPAVEQADGPLVLDDRGLLHSRVVGRAVEHPRVPAVIAEDRTLDYGELLARARGVAAALTAAGVVRGDLVAQVLARGWEQPVAMIGTLLAGAAYLPVDPDLPDARVAHLLEQATTPVVLTGSALLGRLTGLGAEPLDVGACDTGAAAEADAGPAAPGDVAYVIFTSGSTGTPKGVVIEHRAAVNTVAAVNERHGLGPRDRVLGLSSTGFDLSVWDVFGTLSAGATLVLLHPGQHREPAHWLRLVERHRVTVWNSVPALLDLYVSYVDMVGAAAPDSLRLALLSGDWIPVRLPDAARAAVPGLEVVSLGGATEAAIWSIEHPVTTVEPDWVSIPYGTALPGQGVHVLDDHLRPCPDHVTGELYISGHGLARGYWRRPDLTAERFPHLPGTGHRLYRTGDLGRRRPDGVIEFLGREDDQVKVQGHRIELGEIEAHLAEHPGVQAAVVVTRPNAAGGHHLVGHVVPAPGASWDEEALVEHLRRRLPAYMVPPRLVRIDALPLSPNGKVDRRALPAEPVTPSGTGAEETVADDFEHLVGAAMADVLGLGAPVAPDGDFFAEGGNSFAALRLAGRLRELTGTEVRLSLLFHLPRPRDLAAAVRDAGGDPRVQPSIVPLRPDGTLTPLFLLHPVGGSVMCYRDLVSALHRDRPVIGLQRHGQPAGSSVLDLAAHYADLVESVRPTGPVAVGGWSMGGVLAFEVAGRLRERGRDVALVLAVDSAPETGPPPEGDHAVASFLTDLHGGREPDRSEVEELAAALRGDETGRPDAAALRDRYALFLDNSAALARHRAEPRDLRLVLVGGGRSAIPVHDAQRAWGRLVTALRIEVLDGEDHHGVVRDSAAKSVAALIDDELREVDATW